jgi:hypothetical protein
MLCVLCLDRRCVQITKLDVNVFVPLWRALNEIADLADELQVRVLLCDVG